MPSFSDLRSDYPLAFSLFECLFSCVLTHRFVATVLPVPPVGLRSLTGENVWSVSWVLAQAAPSCSRDFPDDIRKPNCILSEHRMHLPTQCCSSEHKPPTNHATFALVEPVAHPADHRCMSSRGNSGPCPSELTASLQVYKSAACTVVDVQILPTSRHHLHELLAYSLDCLRAHRLGDGEVSSYELTASLPFGQIANM